MADALAEVEGLPDVAFDAAAVVEALDAVAQQPQPLPIEAAQQPLAPASAPASPPDPMEDERAPVVNTTAPKRGLPVDSVDGSAAPARTVPRGEQRSVAGSTKKRGKRPEGRRRSGRY